MKPKCTPKERIMNAFRHVESDRVPIDLGSTGNTSITKDAYESVKRLLKIDLPSKLMSKNLSTAFVDEVVLERFGVDTRGVFLSASDEWRDIELTPDKYIDEWGITYYKPPGFPFYDTVKHPLAGDIKYGGKVTPQFFYQALHCHKIILKAACRLPYTINTDWTANPPGEFKEYLKTLKGNI